MPGSSVANAVMMDRMDEFSLTLNDEHATMTKLAAQTGGQAFFNTNDLSGAIKAATEQGANYYALSYTPSNKNYNGAYRKLKVTLAGKKYHLAHRTGYYAIDPFAPLQPSKDLTSSLARAAMQQGSPQSRQIVFGARVVPIGKPRIVERNSIMLAGRAWQPHRVGELAACLGGIEAKEINRFTDLQDRIGERLAGLADAQRPELLAMFLEEVSRPLEQLCPRLAASGIPADLRTISGADHAVDVLRERFEHGPNFDAPVDGDVTALAFPLPSVGLAVQLRFSSIFKRSSSGSRMSGSERSQPALLYRSVPNTSRGRMIFGLRLGSRAESSATGSRTSSSIDTCSSAM